MNAGIDSVNKLVEAGIEFAAGQEMMRYMAMSSPGKCPHNGSYLNLKDASVKNQDKDYGYFVVFEGKQAGPFSSDELSRLILEKKVLRESLVWRNGISEWKKAEDIPDVLKLFALVPPPIPGD